MKLRNRITSRDWAHIENLVFRIDHRVHEAHAVGYMDEHATELVNCAIDDLADYMQEFSPELRLKYNAHTRELTGPVEAIVPPKQAWTNFVAP